MKLPRTRSVLVDRDLALYNMRHSGCQDVYVPTQGDLNHNLSIPSKKKTVTNGSKNGRGFSHQLGQAQNLCKALGVPEGQTWTRADCKRLFNRMDADGSGELDFEELADWLMKNEVLGKPKTEMDRREHRTRIMKVFSDMDSSGDKQLDFEEFHQFCKLIEREVRQLRWASKHYLTTLPKSHEELNHKKFTIAYIEKELQAKVEQFTSRDSDRFRQILCLFRTQVQRSYRGKVQTVLAITRRDFNKMLSWLGLFATEEQADYLFKKYDHNGDGALTCHEFLTKCRPDDYPGSRRAPASMFSENKGGKKIYPHDVGVAHGGESIRLPTPHPDVHTFSSRSLAKALKQKMGETGKTGQMYTDAMGRRDLLQTFTFFDKKQSGLVSMDQFKKAMKMVRYNNFGVSHLDLVHDQFGKSVGGGKVIDYLRFVSYVYPDYDKHPDYFCKDMSLALNNKEFIPQEDGSVRVNVMAPAPFPKPASMTRSLTREKFGESVADLIGGRPLSPPMSESQPSTRRLQQSASSAVLGTNGIKAMDGPKRSSRAQSSLPGSRSRGMSRSQSTSAIGSRAETAAHGRRACNRAESALFTEQLTAGKKMEKHVRRIKGHAPRHASSHFRAHMPTDHIQKHQASNFLYGSPM